MKSRETSEAELDELISKVVEEYGFEPNDPKESDKKYYLEYHKNRFKETLDSIPSLKNGTKLLDIGPTHFTLVVKHVFPGYSISAIDISDSWAARMSKAGIEFRICDLARQPIPFDSDCFDVVLFTEVLEHVFAPHERILKDIGRVMKKNARLVFSMPNIATFTNRIRFLFGVNPTTWAFRESQKHGHLHEFTKKEATDLLEKCNFSISRYRYIDNCRRQNTKIPRADRPRLSLLPSFRQTILFECNKSG
jgi:SAM-dependent methyltransferase